MEGQFVSGDQSYGGASAVAGVSRPDLAPFAHDEVGGGEGSGIDLLLDISVDITVELGRTHMTIGDVMALRSGSVIDLDKLAGEPADILVNGTRIARGEVLVVDEKFGVRVLEVESSAKRLATLE
ncbi:MAG: flagellar motor switch protein FliN [Chloroflexota bacterium]|jgi:flagellar motor switch protein FliN/FliY|nr:flagellar motor switch protein FliN [Chloroflexota bacterium]